MAPPRLTLVPKHASDPTRGEQAASAGAASGDQRSAVAEGDGDTLREGTIVDVVTGDPVALLASQDRREKLRIIEAILFAAPEPLAEDQIAGSLVAGDDVAGLLGDLQQVYAARGVNLVRVAGKWAFRTADDLAYLLQRYAHEERRLSRAALETLSIIAYHQPVTRAEIEDIRGVSTSAGTIDILLETAWIRPRGRRRAPGRPVTYGTTESFLTHFGLESIKDLPGLADLKGAGLLDSTLPPGFSVPEPRDVAALMPDELPLDAEDDPDDAAQGALIFEDEAADETEFPAGTPADDYVTRPEDGARTDEIELTEDSLRRGPDEDERTN